MSIIRKSCVAIGLSILLTGCGSSDDSPVIHGKNLHEIGEFVERSELLTPGQKKDLQIAVPNLMNQWVIDHGLDEDYEKDLTEYFDGMHVNEVIKLSGTKPNLGAKADAQAIGQEYQRQNQK